MRQTYWISLAAALCAALAAPPARAVDGSYDERWQGGGRELIPIVTGRDARLRDMLVQPDGKLVLAGDCDAGGAYYECLARLLPDGTLDLGFGPYSTGRFTFQDYPDRYPPYGTLGGHGLLRQADGRFLIAGHGLFNGVHGEETDGTLARLTADGDLELDDGNTYTQIDFDYNASTPGGWVEAVALQPDGRILLAGATNRPDSSPTNRDCAVARLNADRSQDFTFGDTGRGSRLIAFDQGGGNDDYCQDIAVQRDGKIVVVGYTEIVFSSTTVKDVAVARLNADGSYDTTFGNAGRVWFTDYGGARDTIGYAVKIDRQQRILIAGLAQYAGDDSDMFVARLLPSGAMDAAFSGGVRSVPFDIDAPGHDLARDIALQSDGRILVAGSASLNATADVFAVARLNDDGTPDASFGIDGESYGSFAPGTAFKDIGTTIAIGGGGIFVAGEGDSGAGEGKTEFGVARLTLDLLFTDGFQ